MAGSGEPRARIVTATPYGATPFDVEAFLAQPLVARVAAGSPPTIRPVWYLWEQGEFWWLHDPRSRLPALLDRDPRVALVVDTCDLVTGTVKKVTAMGRAEVVALDRDRALRKFTRYLGPDPSAWDPRFVASLGVRGIGMIRLKPETLFARDVSFTPPSAITQETARSSSGEAPPVRPAFRTGSPTSGPTPSPPSGFAERGSLLSPSS